MQWHEDSQNPKRQVKFADVFSALQLLRSLPRALDTPFAQAPDGRFDVGQPDKRSQHERHLLTTVVCYLAPPNSKDPLSAARAALDELQKAAIHAIADNCAVQGTQCNSCKLSSQIYGALQLQNATTAGLEQLAGSCSETCQVAPTLSVTGVVGACVWIPRSQQRYPMAHWLIKTWQSISCGLV